MWIQVVLIAAVVCLFLGFSRYEQGVGMRASKRLAFLAFVALNVYGVLRPDHVTWVANRLGVGRGADLLLYIVVVVTIFLMLNTYLRFRSVERQMTDLVRSLAIRDAERDNAERLGPDAMHS
jgi:small membrane protein